MKSKQIARFLGFSFVTIVVTSLFAGCAVDVGPTYRAYDGPALPHEKVALLKLENGTTDSIGLFGLAYFGIGLESIDDKPVSYKFGDTIELLPGEHTMVFIFSAPNLNIVSSSGPISRKMVVEAGKAYKAKAGRETQRTDAKETVYRWWVEITEK